MIRKGENNLFSLYDSFVSFAQRFRDIGEAQRDGFRHFSQVDHDSLSVEEQQVLDKSFIVVAFDKVLRHWLKQAQALTVW